MTIKTEATGDIFGIDPSVNESGKYKSNYN